MTRNTTRVGRRRRVLKEEVLSASSSAGRCESTSSALEPGDTPRYGVGANIENHPQVTSYVPRRFSTLGLIMLCGLGVAATAELVAHNAQPLSELVPVIAPAEITEVFANRLVAWTAAAILLAVAAYTRLIFSLRRHRVDDYRGRYRIWRTAGWAAIVLSLNAVLGGHGLVARALEHFVSYQLLPVSTLWWLVPAAACGGWLLIKLVIDTAECRTAMTANLLAIVCLTMAGAHSAGWSPAWADGWPDLLSRALPLSGFTLLLLGSQLFARYLVLDVQGLIEHATTDNRSISQQQETPLEVADTPSGEPAIEEPPTSNWVDGSEPDTAYEDDSDPRLSKAQRKRLRKQKQRRAA